MDNDITVLLETTGPDLEKALRAGLPDAEVSTSDNFGGGSEIAVFVKPTVAALKSVLEFLTARRASVSRGTLSIGATTVEIRDFTLEEIERLMANPAVADALERLPRT